MLRVNPATAFRMLSDFVPLKPGNWVVQNVANSGVGRAVIHIARSRGVRTVNVVRRTELIGELKAEGADVVLLDSDALEREIPEATGGGEIFLALNAVGGESALRLAKALAPGGTIVTYGAMGRQPLRIPAGMLIFHDLRWRGFWVTRWYSQATGEIRDAMFAELFALARRGAFAMPIAKIYPLADAQVALEHAAQGGRAGQILFDCAITPRPV